jgi:Protein of unknown function, DUF417
MNVGNPGYFRSPITASTWLTSAGEHISRYGLVIVLAWIGFGKYVKMEARVLIEHSPLMSWIYHFLGVGTVAATLGTAEIIAALLIALRPLSPAISAVGSAMAGRAVPRDGELLVHDAGARGRPARRYPDPRGPAWSVPAQSPCAVGSGRVDIGRIVGRVQKIGRDNGSD